MPDWKKVFELTVSNPDLIIAFVYLVIVIGGGAFALAWMLRGLIAKERVNVLQDHLKQAGTLLQDSKEKLELAVTEQGKLQQQVQNRAAPEKIAISLFETSELLRSATNSTATAATYIVAFPTLKKDH